MNEDEWMNELDLKLFDRLMITNRQCNHATIHFIVAEHGGTK
ncbi:MAG: hypothetical protein WC209_06990 [Ignavibacteriaceae bacterium]|jgi:hypothetical protein